MDVIINLEDIGKNARASTLGYLVKLSQLLDKSNAITKYKKSDMDNEYIARFLDTTSRNLTLILKELDKCNLLKEKNNIKYINPKHCRHLNFDNNSDVLGLFKGEQIEKNQFYVYRFMDKNNKVLYVGRTHDLKRRLRSHLSNGHLPTDCYSSIYKIEYMMLENFADMALYEVYMINKFCPEYNTQDKSNTPSTIELPIKEWILSTYN